MAPQVREPSRAFPTMTDTPRIRPEVSTARMVATGACALGGISGVSAFTVATAYPFPLAIPPSSILITAGIWLGAAAVATAAAAAAQRWSGKSWASAFSADALTYLPLTLLWAPALAPRLAHVGAAMFWSAVAATGAAKVALLAPLWRRRIAVVGVSSIARWIAGKAMAVSAVGRAVAPFALVALAARWQVMQLYDGLAQPEEGLLAHAAQVLLSGGAVYRDLRSVFPPGQPYLHAGMFAALGPTLVVGKVALALGPILTSLAVFYVAHRMMPAGMAFLGAALIALTGEGSLAAFLALCAVGVGFARSGDRRANWILAGMLVGAAIAFDLVVGAAAAAALIIMLYLRQRSFVMRRIGAAGADLALGPWAVLPLALGAAVVWGPLLLYLASRGALGDAGADLLSGVRGEVFRLLRPTAAWTVGWTSAMIYALGGGLLLSRLVWRRLGEADFVALTVIALGAAGEIWSRHTGDSYHLALCAPAAYVIATWLWGWSAKAVAQSLVGWPGEDSLRVPRAGVAALVLIGGIGVFSGWGGTALRHAEQMAHARALVEPPRAWKPLGVSAAGGAYVRASEAQPLAALVDYLQRRTVTGEGIFCVPAGPAIYLLAERPSATGVDYVYRGEVPPEDVAQAVVALETRKLRVVVLAPADAAWQRGMEMAPLMAGYLARRYEEIARFGDYVVLLRKGAGVLPKAAQARPPPAQPPKPSPPASMFGPDRNKQSNAAIPGAHTTAR